MGDTTCNSVGRRALGASMLSEAIWLVLTVPGTIHAQAITRTLSGLVLDPSETVIPGASATVTVVWAPARSTRPPRMPPELLHLLTCLVLLSHKRNNWW